MKDSDYKKIDLSEGIDKLTPLSFDVLKGTYEISMEKAYRAIGVKVDLSKYLKLINGEVYGDRNIFERNKVNKFLLFWKIELKKKEFVNNFIDNELLRIRNSLEKHFDSYKDYPEKKIFNYLKRLIKEFYNEYYYLAHSSIVMDCIYNAMGKKKKQKALSCSFFDLKSDDHLVKVLNEEKNKSNFYDQFRSVCDFELAHPRVCENKKAIKNKKINKSFSNIIKNQSNLYYFIIYQNLKEIIRNEMLRYLFLIRKTVIFMAEKNGLEEDIFLLSIKNLNKSKVVKLNQINETKKKRVKIKKTISVTKKQSTFKGRNINKLMATGIAHVTDEIDFIEKTKGDILITKNALPSLTLFYSAYKCIITENGSNLCHAAVIAREEKFPLILQVENATKYFNDGDKIKVSMDGFVSLLE